METLATLFRQTREKKGLSLKDVEAATRLPLRYLEVLEGKGDRRLLGDYAYLIPFVRTYATYLGLDPTAAVTQFISELLGREAKETQLEHVAPAPRSSPWRVPLVSLVALLVVFVYLWQRDNLSSWQQQQQAREEYLSPPPQNDAITVAPRERLAGPGVPAASSSTTPAPSASLQTATAETPQESPPPTPPSPPPAPAPSVSPPPHSLRIEAKEPTWIRVVIDNQQQKDVLLKPGEKVEWTAQGGFNLTVGNAGGIRLTLNGKELPPLGKSGQVLRNVQLPAASG
ncbi:MAG: DUF4115 domain-containing protein [Candidatus Binatia bacterium]|nr:DUF4115 domain-containing protein [Candidatus Binatia bacterium]